MKIKHMAKRLKGITMISAAFVAFVSLIFAPAVNAEVLQQQMIIPAYSYPTTWQEDPYWDSVPSAAPGSLKAVIMNPSNGPGKEVNPDYLTQINRNTSNNIASYGYVATSYGSRSAADVKADIDNWVTWYPQIKGIMLDEVATSDQASVDYLKDIYDYIKAEYPSFTVMANPGTHIPDAIAPYADIFITYEGTADTYLSQSYPVATSTFENDPANASRIMHIIYAAQTSQYQQVIDTSRERNAGVVYITNDVMSNPFDTLPSDYKNLTTAIVTPTPKVPSSPQKVSASPVSADSVSVTWQAPATTGSAPISHYIVQYRVHDPSQASSGEWKTAATVNSDTYSYTLSGLSANVQYDVQVLAENEVGVSAPLTSSSATFTLAANDEAASDKSTVSNTPSSASTSDNSSALASTGVNQYAYVVGGCVLIAVAFYTLKRRAKTN